LQTCIVHLIRNSLDYAAGKSARPSNRACANHQYPRPFSDTAASKLIWLAQRNITKAWSRASPDWKAAMNQFAILYGDRFTASKATALL